MGAGRDKSAPTGVRMHVLMCMIALHGGGRASARTGLHMPPFPAPWDAIHDSVGKFCTDNWTERKRYQPMVQNKLLSTIQAYSLGFLTGNPMPWKRFCLFCLFHASLSIVACSVQLVYTKFPNRVIHRALRVCRTRSRDPGYFVKEHNRRWPRYIGPYGRPDEFVKGHDRAQNDGRTNMNEQATK